MNYLHTQPSQYNTRAHNGLQGRLNSLRGEFTATANNAQSLMASLQGRFGGWAGTGEQKAEAAQAGSPAEQPQEAAASPRVRKVSLRRNSSKVFFVIFLPFLFFCYDLKLWVRIDQLIVLLVSGFPAFG